MEAKRVALRLPEDAAPGSVQAIFSRFDVLDKQRDILKRSAFVPLDGAEVPLIWSHNWDAFALGKGAIRVEREQAVFDGAFHLQTQASREAYETVKAMGTLQEYSYGFDIAPDGFTLEDAADGPVRVITKLHRVYEVSPVLVGAGEATGTIAIKSLADDVAALKAGRKLSAASLARIQAALDALTDLLGTQAAAGDADEEGEKTAAPVEGKPIAGIHACRLRPPGDFQADSFRTVSRRHAGKPYSIIMGRPKGSDTLTEQAYRYRVDDDWSAAQARAHCADHDGTFEAAAPTTAAAPLATHAGALAAELHAFRALAAAAPVAELRAAAEPLAALGYLLGDVHTQLAHRRRDARADDAPDTAALYREFTAVSRRLAHIVGEE